MRDADTVPTRREARTARGEAIAGGGGRMGREIAFEAVLLGGVALLAWRLRREIRLNSVTLLFLPIVVAIVVVMQRDLIAVATGRVAPLAALVGLVATRSYARIEPSTGAIVLRATWPSLLVWPGIVALYLLGRRALLWLGSPARVEGLDGLFLIGVAALLLAERGWLYHVYRHAIAPAQRRIR